MIESIAGISADEPISLGTDDGLQNQELGRDAFMRLLVAQLQNQDPTSPTSNEQFITQLAEFSALEEMQAVNENLVALALLQQGNELMAQLTNSSALIGKGVRYTDAESGVEQSGVVGSVRIQDGEAQLRIDGKDVPLGSVTEVTGSEPTALAPTESNTPSASTPDGNPAADDGEQAA